MSGIIFQVNISNGGIPKLPISQGKLDLSGFAGDRFAHPRIHGGPNQAVLLISAEVIRALAQHGFLIYPGALGENLTTEGIDAKQWRSGQQFLVGSARIQLTKPRAPCATLDVFGLDRDGTGIQKHIYDSGVKRGDPSSIQWGKSGFYARVLQPGLVAPGDPIVLLPDLA